jgi:hypothetical protein
MRIGLDLDNTLADYRLPLERMCAAYGVSLPQSDPKVALREELRARGEEGEWTKLQGELYGPLMCEAKLFPGAEETTRHWLSAGCEVFVVSHRTRHAIAGKKHDLHAHARSWIMESGLAVTGVFLEESKACKIARIDSLQCRVFVDDLPDILKHPDFPEVTRKILFDPGLSHRVAGGAESAATWMQIKQLVRV